jgi:hypothetical protein
MGRMPILLVTEKLEPTRRDNALARYRQMGRVSLIEPVPESHALHVDVALRQLRALHRSGFRFVCVALLCGDDVDGKGSVSRAMLARALLPLINEGGALVLESGLGTAQHCHELFTLVDILSETGGNGIRFRVRFEPTYERGDTPASTGRGCREPRAECA